jgi:hypothetical protein
MKYFYLCLVAALSLFFLPPAVRADDFSDLKSDITNWLEKAKALYALNTEDLNLIWEAYCGLFDPSLPASLESANEIGQNLQHRQDDQIRGLRSDLQTLRNHADKIKADSETTSDQRSSVDDLMEETRKVERNLEKLDKGVILSGSNNPFVKLAIEYGKEEHKRLCNDYDDSKTGVCDRNFPTLGSDRPDLVTFNTSYGLSVIEFKPKNDKAIDKGWKQVEKYTDGVLSYYTGFFPNGPLEATKGVPGDEQGGQKILDLLAESRSAWDGDHLKLHIDVRTYNMCDKPYDELK